MLIDDSPNDVELVTSALRDSHPANEIIIAEDGKEANACFLLCHFPAYVHTLTSGKC